MTVPVQVSFRGIDPSEFLEAEVRQRAEVLGRHSDRIIACKVVLEPSGKSHHKGNTYHVRIDLTVPGKEIVVSRDPSGNHAHEDMHVAIRDAFAAARRQLEDYVRIANGDVKNHRNGVAAG